ncbi:hypothetical protein Vau01_007690 [Virgisporangium aurantiacum]|uniref:Uncharacterized protein n=1 Tax=Virgisporangium aurantiacum TaxID=175570 RepID=A0A8J3YYZ5_9ACTN|nr:hypothetical protein Vau01_007690 [Virgisporangium aurantiacum]
MSSTISPSGRNPQPPSPGFAPKMLPPMQPTTADPAVTAATMTAARRKTPARTRSMLASGGKCESEITGSPS